MAPRTIPEGYTYHASPPSVEANIHLRTICGLTPKSGPETAAALSGSWFCAHLTYLPPSSASDPTSIAEPTVVGMGRVIGDGGWYFHILDMAVHPDHQRLGLGDFVLGKLLQEIDERAPAKPYVNLVADPPGRRLYERHGFRESSTLPRGSVAMERCAPGKDWE